MVLKSGAEILRAGKSTQFTDLRNGMLSCLEQLQRVIQPDVFNEVCW